MPKNFLRALCVLIIVGLSSCSEEQFTPETDNKSASNPGQESFGTNQVDLAEFDPEDIDRVSQYNCAFNTLIRPPVDILFLWDNSSSQTFINEQTKNALNATITRVSDKFDYHIMMAPLIPVNTTQGQPYQFVIARNMSTLNLNSSQNYMKIPAGDLDSRVNALASIPIAPGSKEEGLKRVADIISQNGPAQTNIFRSQSTVIVVLMSNEDDDSYFSSGVPNPVLYNNLIANSFNRLKGIRDGLQSLDFRLLSLIADPSAGGSCPSGSRTGQAYKTLSRQVYYNIDPSKQRPGNDHDQFGREGREDTYNICGNSFGNIFQTIDGTIQQIIVGHRYNYWPVGGADGPEIDPNSITVRLNHPTSGTLVPQGGTNGWQYVGYRTNQNLRFFPTPGVPTSGRMIQLNGSAILEYPNCLYVETQSPQLFWAYFSINKIPDLSTVRITKNGNTISQSTTNGWEYIGYREVQNVRVKSLAEPNVGGTPAQNESGYFFRFHGDAISTNNDVIRVRYKPATL